MRDGKGSRTKGRVGVVGSEYQRGTSVEGAGEEMRGNINIGMLVSSNLLLFINFTSLIDRFLQRKPSSLAQHPPSLIFSFLLPIPLFLLASILSVSSLTPPPPPATCDFLCTVSFSLSFSRLPFHQLFDATLVDSFLNPTTHPNPLSYPLSTRCTQCSF